MPISIPFVNAYAALPDRFFAYVQPTAVANPVLIQWNATLAAELGIQMSAADNQEHEPQELAQIFSGNQIPAGAEPIAMAYSGHQFGHFNVQLGDGRAILLGDVIDVHGKRRDIQLKGAGRTPFSRSGDGRSPLGPVLREYLICEFMHAVGVPTTRALAAVSSGEYVYRDGREPGAVFTRVAASHIRVGTVQYFSVRRDAEAVKILADHMLERHYPSIDKQAPDCYLQLFRAICTKQAELIAHWMQLGFIHGVMNTDNMTVSGEGIDYGPCAFMENYHEDMVFSSIDRMGRYAYSNQPAIGQWNLARLAEALLDLFGDDQQQAIEQATAILHEYTQLQHQAWLTHMCEKIGFSQRYDNQQLLIENLLDVLQNHAIDYSLFFSTLAYAKDDTELFNLKASTADFKNALEAWLERWRAALAAHHEVDIQPRMQRKNPLVIPRNHLIANAIAQAEGGDYQYFYDLLMAVTHPFALPNKTEFMRPAAEHERITKTFCGT